MVTIPNVEGDVPVSRARPRPTVSPWAPAARTRTERSTTSSCAAAPGVGRPSPYAANEPRTDVIRDVACASPSTCFVVGYNGSKNPVTIEQWNGTGWTNLTVPQPSLPNSTLSDVACAGTVCFAVGHSSAPLGSPTKTLIVRRTPSGWNGGDQPESERCDDIVTLTGISCPTTTLCFAVGTSDQKTLIERWNGKAWSIVPSPKQPAIRRPAHRRLVREREVLLRGRQLRQRERRDPDRTLGRHRVEDRAEPQPSPEPAVPRCKA